MRIVSANGYEDELKKKKRRPGVVRPTPSPSGGGGGVSASSGGEGGAVTSVFGRDGVVTAESGDYEASEVTFDDDGLEHITGANVQAAIQSADTQIAINTIAIAGLADDIEAIEPGGGSVTGGSYLGVPSPGNAGALYLANDSPIQRYDDGAAWQAYGPVHPLTLPDNTVFSWDNQGGASVNVDSGFIHLSTPGASGVNYRIRKKSAPSTPYVLTVGLTPLISSVQYNRCGICFSDGTKYQILGFVGNNTSIGFWVEALNSATSYSGATLTQVMMPHAGLIWLRLTDDGTNKTFEFSHDGVHFYRVLSQTRTTFLTPTQIGFYVTAENASFGCGVSIFSWKEA